MVRTTKAQQQERMYGCTAAEIEEQVAHMREVTHSGAGMAAMSLLSDVQEMLLRADTDVGALERARQAINVAKYIITQHLIDPASSVGGHVLREDRRARLAR